MRITRAKALDCFASPDLIGIGMEANAVRRQLHPEGVVSYALESRIDCAYRDQTAILAAVRAAEDNGATGIILHLAASLETLLPAIKSASPNLWLQALSTADVLDQPTDLSALHAAGLDAIGNGLAETVTSEWLRVHRAAHAAGIRTTARITFGAGESFADRIDQLTAIRDLQSDTGGFASLAPISFHAAGGRELDETTAVEYLKTLAIARMFVDTIPNLEGDATAQGLKVLQMALRFGANDAGPVHPTQPGPATEEEIRRIIRDAGFRPAQRHLGFRAMLLA
jgi:cyclic dehypoxanthinyl futalosine synthase